MKKKIKVSMLIRHIVLFIQFNYLSPFIIMKIFSKKKSNYRNDQRFNTKDGVHNICTYVYNYVYIRVCFTSVTMCVYVAYMVLLPIVYIPRYINKFKVQLCVKQLFYTNIFIFNTIPFLDNISVLDRTFYNEN